MTVYETVSKIFDKITRRQAYILAIIVSILITTYFILPTITEYLNASEERKERRLLREVEAQMKIRAKIDSIERANQIAQNELFIIKNNQIHDLMSYLERRYPMASHITIFSIHNGGGVPKTGSESKVTVLYTTDNVSGVDILRDYENYPLYSGYAELAFRMFTGKGVLQRFDDITLYPDIYRANTKKNMDFLGTKSIYGAWIESSPTSTYYIILAFPVKNGMDSIYGSFPEAEIQRARLSLMNLIDGQENYKS